MTLTELVLAVMLSLGPSAPGDAERLRPVADAIAAHAEARPLWSGPDGPRDTALDLAVIAAHESGFRDSVRDCRRRGDGGRSIGLWQLQGRWAWGPYTAADICESDFLQAGLGLRVLQRHWARGVRTRAALYRAYATGSAGRQSRAAADMAAMFGRARSSADKLTRAGAELAATRQGYDRNPSARAGEPRAMHP